MPEIQEQAALLALIENADFEWYRVATAVEERGSALSVLKSDWTGFESFDTSAFDAVAARVSAADLARFEDFIHSYRDQGVRLVTVLNAGYPTNLRQIYNRPPFLFMRGEMHPDDGRAVAVVGTREPSPEGVNAAKKLAARLADASITVISGLAKGIDAAAHESTLDSEGRTVAVMGTGIDRIYPKENQGLADRILERGGVLISQFWPDAPPTRASFPMRNVVMSGLAIGTAVVEASSTSGAKMQARLALEHGKRLFLLRSLVMQEEWAEKYSHHGGATVVQTVEDILDVVKASVNPPRQLALG